MLKRISNLFSFLYSLYLITIDRMHINWVAISTICRSHYSNNFWLGLNDLGTEAAYQWSDGSNYDYLNWDSGEPNDYHRQENCIHLIRTNGKWNDQHCQRKLSYICKAYKGVYELPPPPPAPFSEYLLFSNKYVIPDKFVKNIHQIWK